MAKRAESFHYTVAELERMTDADVCVQQSRRAAGYHEVLLWVRDSQRPPGEDSYRDFRRAEEAKRRKDAEAEPLPTQPATVVYQRLQSAPAPPARVVATQLSPGLLKGLAKPIRERFAQIETRLGSLANAERVVELSNRIAVLEARLADAEKRVGGAEARASAHSRHLSNIQVKLSGVGRIERSPRTQEEQP